MWTVWVWYATFAIFVGGCLSLPVGLAFWAALSNRKPATRLSGVLAAILLLAYIFDFSQPDPRRMVLFGVLALFAGAVWVLPNIWWRVAVGLIGVVIGIGLISQLPTSETTQWATAVLIGLPVLAIVCCIMAIRLSGFRVLKLTGQYSDREVEIGTGRTVDEWVRLFAEEHGLEVRREEVVRIAREDGAPFAWQRVIADAIDIVAGRTVVGVDEMGRPQTIAERAQSGLMALLSPREGRFRWSIAQVMFLSLSCAVIAAIVRALEVPLPDLLGTVSLIAMSVALAVVGSAVVYTLLNLHRDWRIDVGCAAIVVATSLVSSCCWSLHPKFALGAFGFWGIGLPGFIGFATAFALGTILVRHRGYRLVLVGRGRSPALN